MLRETPVTWASHFIQPYKLCFRSTPVHVLRSFTVLLGLVPSSCVAGARFSFLLFLRRLVFGGSPACSRWGAMIGRIEARALKYNSNWQINFPQRLLVALRTACQRRISKMLLAFKLHTAIFTPVGIDRHAITSTNPNTCLEKPQKLIIARSACIGKLNGPPV